MAFDLDDEENKATRKMNGASKEKEDKNDEIEYEKMIIDIPKKTIAVSVVTISEENYQFVMNTRTYSTEDVKKRKIGEE